MMFIFDFLFRPSVGQRVIANNAFFALVLATPALTGSLVSFALGAALVFPFLWIGRYDQFRSVPREIRLVAAAFAVFFLWEAFLCLMLGGENAFSEAVENTLFLAVLPIWWVLRALPVQLLKTAVNTAGAVAIASLVAAAYMVAFLGLPRIELSTGNSNVLAVVASVLLLFNLLGMASTGTLGIASLSLAGAIASALLVVLSGSRTMWAAVILVPVLVLLVMRKPVHRINARIAAAIVLGIAISSTLLYQPVMKRISRSLIEIEAISSGDTSTSIGQRFVLWQAARELVSENPLTGVGPGNYQERMAARTLEMSGHSLGYSHAHNLFINSLVRGGVPGLLSMLAIFVVPLVIGFKSSQRPGEHRRLFWAMLMGLQAIYLIAGMTGLAIGHDILDSVFIAGTVLALYGLLADDTDQDGRAEINASHQ